MFNDLTQVDIILKIIGLIGEGNRKEVHAIVDELQPYDIAELYKNLPEKHRPYFLKVLELNHLADLMEELARKEQLDVLNKLGSEKSAKVLDLMDNDDLADLLIHLAPEKKDALLAVMRQEESRAVQDLMKYPSETAGRLMTNRYVWIRHYYTVREAVGKLKDFAEIAESINYLYVIDDNRKLIGVVSYRDLLLAEAGAKIADIMYQRVISVAVDTDQEKVARIIEKYDFFAVPVVEKDNVLVGIVTIDDVVDILISEATEDIEKLSASGKAIDFDTKALTAAYRRLPWLILLLLIGLISGTIISRFEETLQKVVALAFFMPMIAGMTGNTGTQSLAVVVRGLITRDIDRKLVFQLIMRELRVGVIIGVICGLIISLIAFVWQGNPYLGLVVGSSLVMTLIIGTMAGTVIPLVLYRLNIDPAVASGPLITTLNDILSLTIYFGIASVFVAYLM